MTTDRLIHSFLARVALAAALVLTLGAEAQSLIVCRTPDGATYATDNPPPDCAPIPSETFDRQQPLGESEPTYGEESSRDGYQPPETTYRESPPETFRDSSDPYSPPPPPREYQPPVSEESRRAAAEESPESDRTHAIAACEQVVAERLERPSTARWPNRGDYKYQARGSTQYQVEGYVEAEKALGSGRINWKCDAVYSGDRWIASAQLFEEESGPAIASEAAPKESFPPARSSAAAMPPVVSTTGELRPPPLAEPPPTSSSVAASDGYVPPAVSDRSAPPSANDAYAPPIASARTETVDRWKEQASCPGVKFDASAQKNRNEGYQVVSGQITYTGRRPVRDVRVCASGVCTLVRNATSPMTQGASEKFEVRVPSLETPVVTAQCSVMVEGPGT